MAEIPSMVPEVPSMIQESSSDLSSFPRTRLATVPGRRSQSPPAPTIDLRGFNCVASDPEYHLVRSVTGNVQPYWFEETRSHADHYGTSRRQRREDPTRRADRDENTKLDGPSTEKDKGSDLKKTQREKEKEAFLEAMWPTVRNEYYAMFGLTRLSPKQEKRMKADTMAFLEEEWNIMEEERRAEKREKKEQGKPIVRLRIRNPPAGPAAPEKKFKMKGKAKAKDGSGAETKEVKSRSISQRLRKVLHLLKRPTPQDPVVTPPFHPIL